MFSARDFQEPYTNKLFPTINNTLRNFQTSQSPQLPNKIEEITIKRSMRGEGEAMGYLITTLRPRGQRTAFLPCAACSTLPPLLLRLGFLGKQNLSRIKSLLKEIHFHHHVLIFSCGIVMLPQGQVGTAAHPCGTSGQRRDGVPYTLLSSFEILS